MRQVEVEDNKGQITLVPIRFVAVYSTQLAQRHAEAHAHQQYQEAKSLATYIAQVQCRQFACHADAEGVIVAYEGRGPGRRGRPRKGEAPQEETVYQLQVTTQALGVPVATFGWLVLATTIEESRCSDAEIVRAYRDQTTMESGFRFFRALGLPPLIDDEVTTQENHLAISKDP